MFLFFLYPRHKYIRKISMVLVYMYILYETANAWTIPPKQAVTSSELNFWIHSLQIQCNGLGPKTETL